MGLTELLSWNLGQAEKEWVCKERMNTLPTFDLHQLIYQENQVFWTLSFMNNISKSH
jgi:hypothetical protein